MEEQENGIFEKKIKIFQKSLKKCLTKAKGLWYYRQALAEKGGSAKLKLGKKQIKNGIRKK